MLLIALLGLILYSNILYAPFVYDDSSSIIENESVRSISGSLTNILSNRYLTALSFAFNYAVGGLKPFGYHVINNLIHIINALLVCYLVILTFKTPFFRKRNDTFDISYFIAFSSAFVFIAHPIQTQAVTYVVQRAVSMATMFYLLSLVMYVKARLMISQKSEVRSQKSEKKQKISGFKSMPCYLLSVISAILAMKTKEIAFTLPVIVILYEFFFLSGTSNSKLKTPNWKRFLYLFPILLTILIIPLSMLNIKGQPEGIAQVIDLQSKETINISRADYLITQFRVILTYLRLLILPINQNFDYVYPVYHSFFDPDVFMSFIFLLLIFGAGVYFLYISRIRSSGVQNSSGKLRLVAFGIFWFFMTLSVESSIIPIRDVIVEHRLYLPSIGFFIALVSLTEYLLPFTKLKTALMIIVVVLLSIGTYSRNITWKDPQALWEDVIAKAPNNSRAYNNLGVVFKERKEFDRAVELFEKSLGADRNYTAVYYNLGDVQYRLGNYENAIAYLKQALTGKLNPKLQLDILNKLGRTYSAMGQTEKAIETFEEAVKIFPSSIVLLNNLGVQYIKNGRTNFAIEIYEKAIKIEEKAYLYNNLALAYAQKGDKEKSRLMQRRALELRN
jgi:tetratricopeptide (TPR) repeat protein